jgi:hypothetical protein
MAKVLPNKEWGTLLAKLRQRSELSGAAVVRRLSELGIKLDRRTLYTYEAGRVLAPDAAVVWGLSQIYAAKVEELLVALVASRNGGKLHVPVASLEVKRGRFSLSLEEKRFLKLFRQLRVKQRSDCEKFVRFQLQESKNRQPASRGGD